MRSAFSPSLIAVTVLIAAFADAASAQEKPEDGSWRWGFYYSAMFGADGVPQKRFVTVARRPMKWDQSGFLDEPAAVLPSDLTAKLSPDWDNGRATATALLGVTLSNGQWRFGLEGEVVRYEDVSGHHFGPYASTKPRFGLYGLVGHTFGKWIPYLKVGTQRDPVRVDFYSYVWPYESATVATGVFSRAIGMGFTYQLTPDGQFRGEVMAHERQFSIASPIPSASTMVVKELSQDLGVRFGLNFALR